MDIIGLDLHQRERDRHEPRALHRGARESAAGEDPAVAVSVFPDELYPAPRSWTERAFPKLIYYNRLPKGGHFAAWEQPQLLTEDLRAGFRSLRSTQGATH